MHARVTHMWPGEGQIESQLSRPVHWGPQGPVLGTHRTHVARATKAFQKKSRMGYKCCRQSWNKLSSRRRAISTSARFLHTWAFCPCRERNGLMLRKRRERERGREREREGEREPWHTMSLGPHRPFRKSQEWGTNAASNLGTNFRPGEGQIQHPHGCLVPHGIHRPREGDQPLSQGAESHREPRRGLVEGGAGGHPQGWRSEPWVKCRAPRRPRAPRLGAPQAGRGLGTGQRFSFRASAVRGSAENLSRRRRRMLYRSGWTIVIPRRLCTREPQTSKVTFSHCASFV